MVCCCTYIHPGHLDHYSTTSWIKLNFRTEYVLDLFLPIFVNIVNISNMNAFFKVQG